MFLRKPGGYSEINNPDITGILIDDDIVGINILMHDISSMYTPQYIRDPDCYFKKFREVKWTCAEVFGKCDATNIFHDQYRLIFKCDEFDHLIHAVNRKIFQDVKFFCENRNFRGTRIAFHACFEDYIMIIGRGGP